MITIPRVLHFHSCGRVDAEPRRQIMLDARALAASRTWWCGAPILTEEKKTPQKKRGRMLGDIELLFGWSDEDDAFMASRDARFMIEQLRRWYTAVAGSTFEARVVAVSPARTGILWFGDED